MGDGFLRGWTIRIGVVVGVMCVVGTAVAVKPTLWREDTQEAFAKGEAEGVSLTRDGAVTLAPALEEMADTGEQFVWSLARDNKGRVYAGTGNDGKIYRLEGDRLELLFDSPAVAVYSLAVGADGSLYAGCSPEGTIYRLVPGKDAAVFCQTGDEHVWALVADGRGGLYAATGGEQGRILRISSKGKAEEVYRSSDHNIVALIRQPDGRLYAGTDENGLVYRVDADGKAQVLYDAPESEIHALAAAPGGVLYAAAMSGDARPEGIKPGGPQSPQGGGSKGRKSSVLYAIRPSGAALRLWESPDPMVLSLNVESTGDITVVTGDKGHIYRVGSDGSASLVRQMPDVQPWASCALPDGRVCIDTAGAGRIYRLGNAYAPEGTLTAEPRDFVVVSRWGKMAWKADTPGGTSVSFQTRSGNSETPDDTWSDWSGALEQASGSQILSPPARFLQYRIRLVSKVGKASPQLREVTLSGLQENVQPMVVRLEVSPPNQTSDTPSGGGGNAGAGKNGGKRAPNPDKGVWKIAWVAGDVNGDELTYALYFRGRDEKTWKLLEEDLTSPIYRWDTESAPEGTVQVRVVASDHPSNPPSLALSSEKISEPFDIDHTPPAVRLTGAQQTGPGKAVVEGMVTDAVTPIQEAAYALNAGPWQVVFPADEIFDSRTEAMRFAVDALPPGEYTVVLRAVDALGNVGVGKLVFEIK